jgi:ATP-dependent Clp protease protease subunit
MIYEFNRKEKESMPKAKKDNRKKFTASLSMAGGEAVLDITGCIGWDTEAIQFTDLVAQAKEAGCAKLTVRINSMGGYCYDGLAIGDCLRNCGMETVGVVYGTAQSMASYILQCCTVRQAHKNATLMFHQPSAGVYGTVDELLVQAQYLCGMRDKMFEDMGARCGMSGEALSQEHMTMKMYSAEQALERGFIDEIAGEGGAAATDEDGGDDDATEEDAQVQNAGGVNLKMGGRVFDVELAASAAMMAATDEEGGEDATDDAADASTDDAAGADEDGSEDAAAEDGGKDATDDAASDASTAEDAAGKAENAGGGEVLTREVVAQMIAEREAAMMAALGVKASDLPAAHGGECRKTAGKEYSMSELDAMPAMQRLEVLQANPELAARYAANM